MLLLTASHLIELIHVSLPLKALDEARGNPGTAHRSVEEHHVVFHLDVRKKTQQLLEDLIYF